MKIALVHDHLAQLGGAEKTLQALTELFPAAPLYTLLYNPKQAGHFFNLENIRPSFLQRMPGGVLKYQWYMPLMSSAIESFDLSGYDIVVSSASSFAKGVITSPQAVHICYCHTPTRYLWHYSRAYLDELAVPKFLKKIIGVYLSRVRQWDAAAAQRVDCFIANSQTTQARIKKYYRRESVVIHPPVDTHSFKLADKIENYFLTGGRLTPYKRFDLAIAAFNKLQLPLVIFGEGPDRRRLQKLAGPTISFVGAVSDEQKAGYFSHCRAFINPQEEDFGITQIEALASGRPVIAYNSGGAAEVLVNGQNGILFDEQTWEELADAVLRLAHTKEFNFNPASIKQSAERFSSERFKNEITEFINRVIANYEHRH
jgi:glycosyltransferase involved in cell wall biosynthesis